jgi:hypothetical protein
MIVTKAEGKMFGKHCEISKIVKKMAEKIVKKKAKSFVKILKRSEEEYDRD